MGPLFVLAVIAAVLTVALGLQVLSRRIQRYPLDGRRPDLLIDVASTRRSPARPPELAHLTNTVADAMSSPAVARAELQPVLDELAAAAPMPDRAVVRRRRRPSRRSGDPTLETAIEDLELAWGLLDGQPPAPPPPADPPPTVAGA